MTPHVFPFSQCFQDVDVEPEQLVGEPQLLKSRSRVAGETRLEGNLHLKLTDRVANHATTVHSKINAYCRNDLALSNGLLLATQVKR